MALPNTALPSTILPNHNTAWMSKAALTAKGFYREP